MEYEICVERRAKVTSGKPNLITSAALLLRDFWLVGCILTQTKPKRDGMDPLDILIQSSRERCTWKMNQVSPRAHHGSSLGRAGPFVPLFFSLEQQRESPRPAVRASAAPPRPAPPSAPLLLRRGPLPHQPPSIAAPRGASARARLNRGGSEEGKQRRGHKIQGKRTGGVKINSPGSREAAPN